MTQPLVLVVEGSPRTLRQIATMLRSVAKNVFQAETAGEALDILATQPIDVVFTELRVGDTDAISMLCQARRRLPGLVPVIVTASASIEACIEAMRYGAADFVVKPVSEAAIRAALDRATTRVRRPLPSPSEPEDLVSLEEPCLAAVPLASSTFDEMATNGEMISVPLMGSLKKTKRALIQQAVFRYDGNKTAAARALGISRRTLYRILDQ